MKSQKNTAFNTSILSAALMATFGTPAFAQDADLSQWVKPEMSVTVGAGFQDNDRPQLGIFDGRRENTAKLLLDADIKHRDDVTGTWNELQISNFGLDNRELEFRHSRQGDYGVSFEYSRIPRETPYTVNTGLQGNGETQVVNVVVPGTGPRNIELGTHRDRYTFGLNKIIEGVLDGSLDLTVKYRQEEKNGRRHFGSYSGAQAIFLIEPVDSTTRQLDIALSYVGKDLQLQGGYYGSWYENANNLIKVTTATLTNVYVSLPPDNQSYQFYVNGAYAFSPTTKATMRLARSTASQDDYSLLSALPPALVFAGYNGVKAKVVTKDAQFGITTKPFKDLSILANYSYQDRDDRTPHVPYNSQAVPDETTPHSFKNKNAKLEATYRVQTGFKLLGGAYLDTRERSIPFSEFNNKPANPTNAGGSWTIPAVGTNEREVPYRHKTDELTFKAQATKNILDEMNGSLTFSHAKRDGSNFYWADMQNLVNPLHMSDRERDKVGLKLDWSPVESLSLQAQFSQAKDDYDSNGLNGDYTAPNGRTLPGTGITDGKAKLLSLDADFKLNDSWQLTGWYSYDETKAKQFAYQANPSGAATSFGVNPNRKINLEDTGESFGVGLKGKATADISVGADLEWNRSVGKYRQSNIKNVASLDENVPNITNKTIRIALNGTYQMDKKSSIRLDVVYDRWSTDDWSWMMWNNAHTALVPMAYATDGTSASVSDKQSASFVAVRYKFEF